MRPSTPSPLGRDRGRADSDRIIGHLMVESQAILKRVRALEIDFAHGYTLAVPLEPIARPRIESSGRLCPLQRTAPDL